LKTAFANLRIFFINQIRFKYFKTVDQMLIQLHETDKSCLSFGIKVKVVDYILKKTFKNYMCMQGLAV